MDLSIQLRIDFPASKNWLPHKLIDSPSNVQSSQISIMLSNAQEHDRDSGSVDHADESANHVAHCVAFGDDETIHSNTVISQLSLIVHS